MSISVEGQKCPVCKSYMFDDEDIVFCPTCGVPVHRDCYQKKGKCPLEEYHGTDMQYTPPKAAEKVEETKEEPKEDNSQKINFDDEKREGFKNPVNNGGAPFGFSGFMPIDEYGGINKDDQIDGVTAEEMKHAVAVNTQYYIPKFFTLNKQKKTGWNWAAFLIPEGFFFHRKCYKAGILAFLLSVASAALLNFPMVYLTISENMTQQEMLNAFSVILNDPEKLMFSVIATVLGLVISLTFRIVFGLYGNWIYKNEVFDKIKKARESEEAEPSLVLRLKGGVNPFLGLLGLMGVNFVVNLLFMFL